MRNQKSKAVSVQVAVGVVLSLLLAACGTGEPVAEPDDTAASEPTDSNGGDPTGGEEEIDLEIWDLEIFNEGRNQTIVELLERFSDDYPNVTINRRSEPFEDYTTSIRLAATGDSPPTVFQAGQGFTTMGPLVRADALLPLDDFADQYGWWDRYPEGAIRQLRFTPDGESFGEGNIWGVSTFGELVGLFYNRPILERAGVALPTTFEEFEQALADLHAAGEVPIMLGNLEQWPSIMMYMAVQNAYGDREDLRAYIFGDGTFDTDANLRAAEKIQEWVQAGYFNDGFQGLSYPDSITQFLDGGAAFLAAGGSWLTAQIETGLGEDGGFLLLPPEEGNTAWGATGSFSSPWTISAHAEHPEVAAALIDVLTGDAGVETSLASFEIPAFGLEPSDIPERQSPHPDMLRAWQLVLEEDALVHFLDWPAPGGLETITGTLAELFGGQIDPRGFVDANESWYRSEVDN